MNQKQKDYFLKRINEITEQKCHAGLSVPNKSEDLSDIVSTKGLLISDSRLSQKVREKMKNQKFGFYNKEVKIALEPEEYLSNYSTILQIQKDNITFNKELQGIKNKRNDVIRAKATEVKDQIMFVGDDEAIKLIKEFEKFEVK